LGHRRLLMVTRLIFCRRQIANWLEQPAMIEPIHPLERREFHVHPPGESHARSAARGLRPARSTRAAIRVPSLRPSYIGAPSLLSCVPGVQRFDIYDFADRHGHGSAVMRLAAASSLGSDGCRPEPLENRGLLDHRLDNLTTELPQNIAFKSLLSGVYVLRLENRQTGPSSGCVC